MKYLLGACRECHKQYYAKSKFSIYCSKACKQKSWRRRDEQKRQDAKWKLTKVEEAFISRIEDISPETGGYLWELWQVGDAETLKQLFAISQNRVLMDLLLLTGVLEDMIEIWNEFHPSAEIG